MNGSSAAPVVITCAITGNRTTREMAPVPITPDEQAVSSAEAVKAGASIIHLHVRQDDGGECLDPDRYYAAIDKIREANPDTILEITPRATDTLTELPEKVERGNLVKISAAMWGNRPELRPELCAMNISTRNIDENTFILNPPRDVREQIENVYELGLTPRCDVYDLGDIRVAQELLAKGVLRAPLHFLLILGGYSGIGATIENLEYMVRSLPKGSHWTAIGTGSRYNYVMAEHALKLGGNIRTGFEDETYIRKGQKAASNAELIDKYRALCDELGRPAATPEQARQILGL
jgi:3-keto-5-aminohexanoate cleavage enzyme